MNNTFYIIYSIDIPQNLRETYEEYYVSDLIEEILDKNLRLPFDSETVGEEYEQICEDILVKEYTIQDYYNDYFEEYREELENILIDNLLEDASYFTNIVKCNINPYIFENEDKFIETESDNYSEEYFNDGVTSIHRKYIAKLNNEEFVNFAEYYFNNPTENTMGSLTELGLLNAFAMYDCYSECLENTYVSILFEKQLSDVEMEVIEQDIRDLIESGELTVEYLNNL